MTQEQREEIESGIQAIEIAASPSRPDWSTESVWAESLLPLACFARQQLNLSQDSAIPCCKCHGPVIEFTIPNETWNAVMRPDGKETDQEYICESCWHEAVQEAATRPLNLRVDGKELLRKLTDAKIIPWALIVSNDEIQALVMECLTTEEKE
jgi:hypothetical protein